MAAAMTGESLSNLFMIDVEYEFSAPRFYDFLCGESEEDVRVAELWFENALAYAPSPYTHRIKATRTVHQQILCNFGDDEHVPKVQESSENTPTASNSDYETAPSSQTLTTSGSEFVASTESTKEVNNDSNSEVVVPPPSSQEITTTVANNDAGTMKESHQGPEVCCTPDQQKQIESDKHRLAKKIASRFKNSSAMNSKNWSHKPQVRDTKPTSVRRVTNVNASSVTPNNDAAHENPAIKRQKLEGGKSRQILTINKNQNLPHKTKNGTVRNSSNFYSAPTRTSSKKDRKIYIREPATPFVSMAEMMRKFQTSTRGVSLSCSSSLSQGKPKLVLTQPKSPEFETSQRMRPVKIKSSDELEEEMMANIPKFKACPVNKKIFETTVLPPLPRTAPQPPRFKEFHLETMSRANLRVETSTVAPTEATEVKSHQWKPQLSMAKSPYLQTSLRARPPKIKSSVELEKEELKNMPQFKARPLNKKIFESKGDMGIFYQTKKQVTIPREFHFATDERIPPPTAVHDLFDKLSITSEVQREKLLPPTNTVPNPFRLYTEERGVEKEKRLAEELMQKQFEEEMARVPKASPYPYTTDYPLVPLKPEPKPCTKLEPFQLESLMRHEEELRRELEEMRRMEIEAARMREFKAQPILKEDPIPVSEKPRRPLTEVQEFELHVNHRAIDRAEFDKKIKEKEMIYKRYREEEESARIMEEEKELKQLRRTLIPLARPVPKFDHLFLPQKSGKATKAKSPKLHVKQRRDKTTASRMR